MTTKFDNKLSELLSEYSPASLMDTMGGASEKIVKKVEDLPGKSQHWGPLQKLSSDARRAIVNNIIKYVFEDNDENTYSLAINNEDDLKEAIGTAIKRAAQENPEFKAAGKWAVKFLADRLANKELLGNVKYTTDSGSELIRDKDVTQAEVKIALKKAIEKPNNTEDDSEQENLTDTSVDRKNQETSRSVEYNPNTEYYLKGYEEIKSGSLKDDLMAIFDRVSALAGEVLTGKEFVKFFERYGFGIKEVKQLLKANILEPTESEDGIAGDSSGFDVSEEEYLDNLTKDARRDYENSGFNNRFGIDFG